MRNLTDDATEVNDYDMSLILPPQIFWQYKSLPVKDYGYDSVTLPYQGWIDNPDPDERQWNKGYKCTQNTDIGFN